LTPKTYILTPESGL